MKRFLFIIPFLVSCSMLLAQNDSITSRDDIQNNYQIKKILIPDYERMLNFIADVTTAPNEVDEVILNKVKGNKETKIFIDDKVIIESDLRPGADVDKQLRADMDVIQYLNMFNTNYSKSEDKSVSINIIEISPLKKTTYFFYTVLMECAYFGKNTEGQQFNKFNRIAEVKLVNDNGTWHPYINSIYFPSGAGPDTSNIFKGVIRTETDVDKIMDAYDNDEKKRLREENNRIVGLLDEGDDKYDNGDFEGALKKYREARVINIYNKEPQDKITRAKEAINVKKQKELENKEREKHIAEMKINAKNEQRNYNFRLAKLLCDSLLTDYQVNDPEIVSLNEEMSEINASLTSIENAMEHKNLKDAVKICQGKISEAENKKKSNIYLAELYYRLALVYFTLDKSEEKKIFESLGKAIDFSEKHHQEALKLRAEMLIQNNDKSKVSLAIEDATQLINNDSRNPGNYVFRAMIYERDQNAAKAIEDYGRAILYKTGDSTIFLKKGILEYNSGKFAEVKKTTTEGISKTGCYGMLYFYRCLAKDKLNEFVGIGEDFKKAVNCGISENEKNVVSKISSEYLATGTASFNKADYADALNQFGKAISIDSNETALYMRGRCYINLNNNENAIKDFSALLQLNNKYRDGYCQRGMAYTKQEKFKEADKDFESEISNFNDNALAHYAYGISLIKQEDFAPAASHFEQSAQLQYSDSAYYMAALASYYNKKYSRAIENSNNARKKDTRRFEVFYIAGRAFYDIGKYGEAISEFEKAKKLVNYNDDLFFWHAAGLEAARQFEKASQAYDQLAGSPVYKDTANYRSAICLMLTRSSSNYQAAINKFIRYNISSNNKNNSEANAWTAYAYLQTGELEKAENCLMLAKKDDEQNLWLQYVLACNYSKSNKYEEALACLEKAFSGRKYEKSFYDNEPLLKELRKNGASKNKYNDLIEKNFK